MLDRSRLETQQHQTDERAQRLMATAGHVLGRSGRVNALKRRKPPNPEAHTVAA